MAVKNGKIVGFISVHSHNGKPMIGWIGKLLLEKVERELTKRDSIAKDVCDCFEKFFGAERFVEILFCP